MNDQEQLSTTPLNDEIKVTLQGNNALVLFTISGDNIDNGISRMYSAVQFIKDCSSDNNLFIPSIESITAPVHTAQQAISSNDKSILNGGGLKPITNKQQKLIKTIAKEKDIDLDNLITKQFNKCIDNLTGSEANSVIKKIKRM